MFKIIHLVETGRYPEKIYHKEVVLKDSLWEVGKYLYQNYYRYNRYSYAYTDDTSSTEQYISRVIRQGLLKIVDSIDLVVLTDVVLYHTIEYMKHYRATPYRFKYPKNYTFRYDPVPWLRGPSKGRPCRPRKFYKQTLMDTEGRPRLRIEDPWDDWGAYRRTEKNWKSQRKTQWKD